MRHKVSNKGDPPSPALGYSDPGHLLKPKVMPAAEYLKMSNLPNLQSSWENVVPTRYRPRRPKRPKNVVQGPAPNPASSTPSSNPLMEPSGSSAAAPMQGSWEIDRLNAAWE